MSYTPAEAIIKTVSDYYKDMALPTVETVTKRSLIKRTNATPRLISITAEADYNGLYYYSNDLLYRLSGTFVDFDPVLTSGQYAASAARTEVMPTDYTGWVTSPVFIHQYDTSSPYANGGMGGGDIIIENKNFYITGNVRSISAYMPYSTGRKVIIRNCRFVTNSNDNIVHVTDDTHIEMTNCKVWCTLPFGTGRGRFMYAYKPQNITVNNCYMANTGGMKIEYWSSTPGGTINVQYNKCLNIHRNGDGDSGQYQQFLQVQHVTELAAISIVWNYIKNLPGQSRVEDNINLGWASGTVSSPLYIARNMIDGAYPYNPAGPGFTGTGFTTDASDANSATNLYPHNVLAEKNRIIRTCNAAMNIAAGYNVTYRDNDIVTSGLLPGTSIAMASANNAVAIFKGQNYSAEQFHDNSIINNRIKYSPRAYYVNEFLPSGNTLNTYSTSASYSDEEQQFTLWKQDLETNKVFIGSSLS